MNEQEMQFADPDWQPTRPVPGSQENSATGTHSTESAYGARQGVSASSYEQGYRSSQWDLSSSIPPAIAQESGRAAGATHRRSSWWIWLIIIVLLLPLVGGISHSFNRGSGVRGDPGRFPQQAPAQQAPPQQVYPNQYGLRGASQIAINDSSGDVIVQVANGNTDKVGVQTDDGSQPAIAYSSNAATMTISANNSNLIVLVPQNVSLHINSNSGRIEVDGYSGQLSAQSDSGTITLNGDAVNGQSTISSSSGDIRLNQDALRGQVTINTGGNGNIGFSGLLDSQGKYQFTTDSGNIDLYLPIGTPMQVQDSPGSGSYQSDFPNLTGTAPQASVTVKTNSGTIGIHQR
jgi:hypothetical protein